MSSQKSIEEILQLHWMDGAKLSGGSYACESSIDSNEAVSLLDRKVSDERTDERQEIIYEIMRGEHGHNEHDIVKSLQIDVDARSVKD